MAKREPLRTVVAGVGSFTQRVLIPGLVACPEAELVAVFGPTPEKTQQVAQANGIPRAFFDYEQMLDETRPEAVVVATPNDMHAPMALEAIRRGIAVFSEKPLGTNLAQAREMTAAARETGVPTAVNFTYRSTNPMRHVHRLLQQGRVGQPYHFSISFWQNTRADPSLPLAYRMLKERGGGALLDIGVHMMDLLRWYFGDLASIGGVTHTAIPERPTHDGGTGRVTADDTASLVVKLPNGVAGTVQVSQVATGRQNYRRIEIFGSKGSLIMEEDRTLVPVVRLARRGEIAFTVEPLPDDLDIAFDEFPRFHMTRVVRALRGDSTDWPAFEAGLRAQEAVEAVKTSEDTGRWVQLKVA
jgi:predicted dehydrogenase